ncbi:MAG: hypothetical protein IPH18_01025 [Chitinophagaceae bacterium]|nr:hypothetical protein [Chitinophagaceae bacterium]
MRRKIMFALVTVLILSSTSPLQAQPTTALNKQFMDILLAFPSGFNSLKNGVPKYDIKGSSFYSKVNIEGTKYCKLEKNSNTGKLEFIAMILSDDETGYNVFEESFAAWKKRSQDWILTAQNWCLTCVISIRMMICTPKRRPGGLTIQKQIPTRNTVPLPSGCNSWTWNRVDLWLG